MGQLKNYVHGYRGCRRGTVLDLGKRVRVVNYIKKSFVLENIVSGEKEIIKTYRQYVALEGDRKEACRKFFNGLSCGQGEWVARAQASFELIN